MTADFYKKATVIPAIFPPLDVDTISQSQMRDGWLDQNSNLTEFHGTMAFYGFPQVEVLLIIIDNIEIFIDNLDSISC